MLKELCILPSALYRNRRLVKKMAKNDLKSRFAGSYFGTVWAFIQPIVTILVYYFVFGIAMRGGAASGDGTPFVLYLVSGIVPWMYFQEGLVNGTNAFLEYSYLVKKVVFDISVLPVVKLLSALVIHLFFRGLCDDTVCLLWVLSGHLLSGNSLLYDLSFPFDPSHRLYDELCHRLFPGHGTDRLHSSADRCLADSGYVGPFFPQWLFLGKHGYADPEAESVLLHRSRLPECLYRAALVLGR